MQITEAQRLAHNKRDNINMMLGMLAEQATELIEKLEASGSDSGHYNWGSVADLSRIETALEELLGIRE